MRRLLPTLAFTLLVAGSAHAQPVQADPIVGFWNYGGGIVQVTGSGTSFTGRIVKATRFSDCDHPVGELIWRITKTGEGYTGTHAWFATAAPECKLGGPADRGSATWSIVESESSLRLRFCTTSPRNSSDTRCTDLTRAKPVAAAWPKLPDALVSLASVSNGCGGGVASQTAQFGDTSTYLNSNNPLGTRYVVSFRQACNVHDAGYSGAKVHDPFSGDVIDFFGWSQKRIDDKFLTDMRTLCEGHLAHRSAPVALADCKARGGKTSWGALTRYDFVRSWGHRFYRARPNLTGVWTDGRLRVAIAQRLRSVRGVWQDGDLKGEFRGTLISLDQDSIVKGFARTTVGGATRQVSLRIAVDPERVNEIVFTGPALRGTMTR
jgi:hypothetical protein